jgi:hypothetical protein
MLVILDTSLDHATTAIGVIYMCGTVKAVAEARAAVAPFRGDAGREAALARIIADYDICPEAAVKLRALMQNLKVMHNGG